MEKQFIGVLMGLLLCGFSMQSQDSLLVFKASGTILLMEGANKVTPANKGDFMVKSQVMVLEEGADLTSVDRAGMAYRIATPGHFDLKALLRFPKDDLSSDVTTSYFQYLWQEFRQESNNEAIIGGVFRGDMLMSFPPDSALVASSSIPFRWVSTEEEPAYFFLWDSSGSLLFKTKAEGTSLDLFRESAFLEGEEELTWSVSMESYPNMDNLPRFSLRLIDRNRYMQVREEYMPLISDLKSLGLTDEELEKILCEDYGLCK